MPYTEEQKDEKLNDIFKDISEGMPLRQSLKVRGVGTNSFYGWVDDNKERLERYTRAREDRQDKLFEEILEIADEKGADVIIKEDGTKVTNHEAIQRSRLRTDARKWMLGKMNSKKYGDKIEVDQNVKGSLNVDLSQYSEEERELLLKLARDRKPTD